MRLIRLEDVYSNLKRQIDLYDNDLDTDINDLKRVKDKNKIRFREISKLISNDPLLNR